MPKYNIDESRQIAIVWDIIDVQQERPDLEDKEAMEVLLFAENKHDANFGIGWETLRDHAHYLFPLMDIPVSEQDKNNCEQCKFNASISENKCHKYDPDVNAIDEEGDEVYCRNYEEGTLTETQVRALECNKCWKFDADCFDYMADADGNCRNFIQRIINPCQ